MQVLVSFRNFGEAKPFVREGIGVFDLKEPLRGSLGRPDLEDVEEFGRELQKEFSKIALDDQRTPQLSVALGEFFPDAKAIYSILKNDDWLVALERFDYVKIGLSAANHVSDWKAHWRHVRKQLKGRCQLVPVVYADVEIPTWQDALSLLAEEKTPQPHSPTFLIDTFVKDGVGLSLHVAQSELKNMLDESNRCNVRVALAGAIEIESLPMLHDLNAPLVGIRSAVCANGKRKSHVELALLKKFLSAVNHPCVG